MALRFVSFCLLICSWCDVFLTFLSGDGRAAAGTVVIVRSAGAVQMRPQPQEQKGQEYPLL
jgi:hypothetical protein